jgi:hypothetical protein
MKRVFTSLDQFISELLKDQISEVFLARFTITTPLALGKGFLPVINIFSILTAEKDKNLFEICLKLKSVYESDLYSEELDKNKILKEIEHSEAGIKLKLWKNHFKISHGALKLNHEHLFVEESIWKKKLSSSKKKQTGKIFGTVFTKCPSCQNDIIFENQITKNCPYCNSEISYDHENVHFVLETK